MSDTYSSEGYNFEEFSGLLCTNPEKRVIEEFYIGLLPIIVEKWIDEDEQSPEQNMLRSKSSDRSVMSYFLRNVEVKFKNGNSYSGSALGKRLNGEGEFRWSDGSSYKGSFDMNKVIGNGTFSYSNGARYIGQVSYGHRHGKGCLSTDQLTYSGSFFGALFHGPGKLQVDVQSFDGEFLCHKPSFGKRTYENGIFAGVFDEFGSRKCGKFLFKNNDTYKGYWYEDQYNDFGIYKWNTPGKYVNRLLTFESPIYTGYWLDGKRHGIGMLEFDERIIFCNWENDKKTGPGLIMAASGDLYVSDEMFFRDQYKTGRKVIRLKEAKPLIENLLYFFCPKDPENGSCNCCKKPDSALLVTRAEILRDKIKELMDFTDKNDKLLPIFLPKYSIDFTDSIILKFVKQTFESCQEKDTTFIEIKCLNQIIVDNLKKLEMLFKLYATFGIDMQRHDVTLSRLGLWQMYSDIFEKMPEINESDLIDEVESAFNICVRDSHNPFEKVPFWQFLRHILYIVMKLNQNALLRLKTMQDHFSFFGYFGTMLAVFLREFQSKEKLTFKRSSYMIKDQSEIAFKLLEQIKMYEKDPTIRTVFRFYKQYSNGESKNDILKGNLKLIDNALFLQCAQEMFPIIMKDGYFVDINFHITLLQFFEFLLKLFEMDIFQRKLKDAIQLEKLRIKIELREQEEESINSETTN